MLLSTDRNFVNRNLKIPCTSSRTWREGELFIFDDSFEHEVWHNGSLPRLVLILDMWHPELSSHQRRSLPAI